MDCLIVWTILLALHKSYRIQYVQPFLLVIQCHLLLFSDNSSFSDSHHAMLEQHSDSEAMEVAEPAQTGVLIDISPGGEDRDGGVTRQHPQPPDDTREGVASSSQTRTCCIYRLQWRGRTYESCCRLFFVVVIRCSVLLSCQS